jgi:hypothetical protein
MSFLLGHSRILVQRYVFVIKKVQRIHPHTARGEEAFLLPGGLRFTK